MHDPKVPGDEQRAREEYLRHNRAIGEQLRERGLYPDGDVNAFLRTGGLDPEVPGDAGAGAGSGE